MKIAVILITILFCIQNANSATFSFNIAVVETVTGDPRFILPPDYHNTPVSFAGSWINDLIGKGIYAAATRINTLGGSIVNQHRVLYNLTYFNPSPGDVSNNTYYAETTKNFMHNLIDLQTYGKFSAVIVLNGDSIANDIIALKCDVTNKCLASYALGTSTQFTQCDGSQPDCKSRGLSNGDRRFNNTYTMISAIPDALNDYFAMISKLGVKTIAYIAEDSPFGYSGIQGAIKQAKLYNMTILYGTTVSVTNIISVDQYVTILKSMLKVSTPEALILYTRPTFTGICYNLTIAMYQLNWVPNSFVNQGPCTTGIVNDLKKSGTPASVKYSFYQAPWAPNLRGEIFRAISTPYRIEAFPATDLLDSPQVYKNEVTQLFDGMVDLLLPLCALGSASFIFIQKAVESAVEYVPATNQYDPPVNQILSAARLIDESTVVGRMSFDKYGAFLVGSGAIFQIIDDDGSTALITPASIGVAPIYPAPSYDDRISILGLFQPSQALTLHFILLSIVMALRLPLLVLLYRYSQAFFIKLEDPWSYYLVVISKLAETLSMFWWTTESDSQSCNLRMFLPVIGLLISNSTLTGLATAITNIRSNPSLYRHSKYYKTLMSLGAFGITFLASIITSSVWSTSGSALQSDLIEPDLRRHAKDYTQCMDPTNSNGLSGFVIVYIIFFTINTTLLCYYYFIHQNLKIQLPFAKFALLAISQIIIIGFYWIISSNTQDPRALLVYRDVLYFVMFIISDGGLFWGTIYNMYDDKRTSSRKTTDTLKLSGSANGKNSSYGWQDKIVNNSGINLGGNTSNLQKAYVDSSLVDMPNNVNDVKVDDEVEDYKDHNEVEKLIISADSFYEHMNAKFKSGRRIRNIPWLKSKSGIYKPPIGLPIDVFKKLLLEEKLIVDKLDSSFSSENIYFIYACARVDRIYINTFKGCIKDNLDPMELPLLHLEDTIRSELSKHQSTKSLVNGTAGSGTNSTVSTIADSGVDLSVTEMWLLNANIIPSVLSEIIKYVDKMNDLFFTDGEGWRLNISATDIVTFRSDVAKLHNLVEFRGKDDKLNDKYNRMNEAHKLYKNIFKTSLREVGKLIRDNAIQPLETAKVGMANSKLSSYVKDR